LAKETMIFERETQDAAHKWGLFQNVLAEKMTAVYEVRSHIIEIVLEILLDIIGEIVLEIQWILKSQRLATFGSLGSIESPIQPLVSQLLYSFALQFLQKQEEERIDFIKQHLIKFEQAMVANAGYMPLACERMKEKIMAIDKYEDIDCFVREKQTGTEKPKPSDIVFTPIRRDVRFTRDCIGDRHEILLEICSGWI
jgi:hypothetical protein